MPQFLADEVQDYLIAHPLIKPDDRLSNATKNYLTHEMERGCKAAGVKRIRIHDLRHSHVSLLIEMGFSALAIADRLGHESTEVTMMYAHLFPNKQEEMAEVLAIERDPMAATLFEEARAMKEVRDEQEEHR
nr:site-specific integrase [Cryptobacterium curtum]